ncbi:hypothetical protein NOVO_04685 [Rickettsiales bacterium Ac37b]|nr:hypothetical protein NOVO_04685 [Rickettsiales bacterium Ac37b]
MTILGLGLKNNNLNYIEFTAVIERGNSGGPVIDTQGNVVGVVEAKRKYYTVTLNQAEQEIPIYSEPFKTDGMAIGLAPLVDFLKKNNVDYKTNVSQNLISSYNPHVRAERFIVNIHCVRNQTVLHNTR